MERRCEADEIAKAVGDRSIPPCPNLAASFFHDFAICNPCREILEAFVGIAERAVEDHRRKG